VVSAALLSRDARKPAGINKSFSASQRRPAFAENLFVFTGFENSSEFLVRSS